MGFDKDYPNRKDHRKQYNDSRAVDRTCRSHGNCPYCQRSREYKNIKNDRGMTDE